MRDLMLSLRILLSPSQGGKAQEGEVQGGDSGHSGDAPPPRQVAASAA